MNKKLLEAIQILKANNYILLEASESDAYKYSKVSFSKLNPELQEELKEREVEGTAGGEAVKVVVNGNKNLLKLTISPDAVDPDDVEMLQDLIVTAVNDAMKKVDDMTESELGKVTGGLKIPGMF